MGEVVVPIADLALGDNTDGWYELQQPKSQSEGVSGERASRWAPRACRCVVSSARRAPCGAMCEVVGALDDI